MLKNRVLGNLAAEPDGSRVQVADIRTSQGRPPRTRILGDRTI